MPDILTFIYLFPVGILISILGNSAGISGSNFWIPVYIIWLGIDPKTSFWLALLTMFFGFGSGIIRHIRQKTVNWPIVHQYLKFAAPSAILGALLVPFAPVNLLLLLFASFVFIYGVYLLHRFGFSWCDKTSDEGKKTDRIYRAPAALGGFLQGLIATGTGKIIMPCILRNRNIHSPAEAIGSTVIIIFIVNLLATLFRLSPDFISVLAGQKDILLSVMIWVVPGVFIGGQIGPAVAKKMSYRGIRLYVGVLLVIVSLLIYLRVFSGI
jgi:hypothetical protein